MKKLFKKKAKNAPIAAAPVRASAGATVAIDNAGHSSDVRYGANSRSHSRPPPNLAQHNHDQPFHPTRLH